jgi:hypothetical protein
MRKPSARLFPAQGILNGGKSLDFTLGGDGVEKQSGGGSKGLRRTRDECWVRSIK